jgi:ribose transport system ATP-binding protein
MKNHGTALEIREMVKWYPGVLALNRVNLSIQEGEVHGLIGENGAGKSTLIKILAGVTQADEGQIFLNGQQAEIRSGRDAHRLGLSFIHQELNLIPYLNGPENVFLGHPYPRNAFGTVSWKKLRQRTKSIFDRLGVSMPLNLPVSQLPPGNQAMVAIGRAFAVSASIYFMDEPTAALTDNEKDQLFAVIRALKEEGATIVYVSHQLEEIARLTDRVTVMRDGAVVGTWNTKSLDEDTMIRKMIGRELESAFPPRKSEVGDTVLEVIELSGDRVHGVSFELHRGEILGIAGLVGAGRTELLRMLFGVDVVVSGSVLLNGRPFLPRSPWDSIEKGIVLVPEERRTQGLILERSIYENISLVYLRELAKGLFLDRPRERVEARRIGGSVKLKAAGYHLPVRNLSGGNQQKVVFAKCLLRRPLVLLLDEPTRGVDVGARFEIYSIIRDMAAEGTAMLLVSSDFGELLGLSDRLLVLHRGEQKGLIPGQGVDQERLLTYCYGRSDHDEIGR